MLIRTTLIALNQANQTGNYSVLRRSRDAAVPGDEQRRAPRGDLGKLRARNVDMSPLVFFDPKLVRKPAMEGGVLRLTGFIPTKPEQILFDMGFERVGDAWRLSAIVIDMRQAGEPATAQRAARCVACEGKGGGEGKTQGKDQQAAAPHALIN